MSAISHKTGYIGIKIASEKNIICLCVGLFREQIPATPAIQNTKNKKNKNETTSDPTKPK